MYGIINAAVQELVISRCGQDKWEQIRVRAGVTAERFERTQSYPDEVTFRLVDAASHVLGMPTDGVLRALGECWIGYTAKAGYSYMFQIGGSSLKDFLFNLDDLHMRVGHAFANLRAPTFEFDEIGGNRVRMHYRSARPGLCPMLFGLLSALSTRFKTEVQVEHPEATCARHGADHCEFLLTFAPGVT